MIVDTATAAAQDVEFARGCILGIGLPREFTFNVVREDHLF